MKSALLTDHQCFITWQSHAIMKHQGKYSVVKFIHFCQNATLLAVKVCVNIPEISPKLYIALDNSKFLKRGIGIKS